MDNLIKATHPADLAELAMRTHPNGPEVVDHTFHVGAHPPHKEADDFQDNIAKNPEEVDADGVTPKMRRATTSPKNLYTSPKTGQRFLVKPYHEDLNPRAWYARFPIQGWAEMATQALFHASGLGHLAQKVHVSEHVTPKGVQPMLVIAMDPKVNASMDKFYNYEGPQPHKLYDDSVKMGMLDFLANNNDRHIENMMYRQPTPRSKKPASNLLAIDHGRSFNYKRANRWLLPPDSPVDTLFGYIAGGEGAGHEPLARPEKDWTPWSNAHLRHGVDWWKQNRQKIRDEMKHQLQGIKHEEVRNFIERNFNFRTQALDKFADAWAKEPQAYMYDPIINPQAMRIHGVPMLPFLKPAAKPVPGVRVLTNEEKRALLTGTGK